MLWEEAREESCCSAHNVITVSWCWRVLWLVVLVLVVWPLSLLAAIFYVLLVPFNACCGCAEEITEFLHKTVVLPRTVSTFAMTGRSCAGL